MKTKKLFIYEEKILDWISPNTRAINNSTWTFRVSAEQTKYQSISPGFQSFLQPVKKYLEQIYKTE